MHLIIGIYAKTLIGYCVVAICNTPFKKCREPDLNRRTPTRLDPESSAVGQAWLSLLHAIGSQLSYTRY